MDQPTEKALVLTASGGLDRATADRLIAHVETKTGEPVARPNELVVEAP